MSEEQNQELAAPEQTNAKEQELLNRIEALDRKNRELLDEKKKFQKVDKTLQSLPEGVDVQALIDFKNNALFKIFCKTKKIGRCCTSSNKNNWC